MHVRQLVVRHMRNFKDSSLLRCIDVNRWARPIHYWNSHWKVRYMGFLPIFLKLIFLIPDRGWLRSTRTGCFLREISVKWPFTSGCYMNILRWSNLSVSNWILCRYMLSIQHSLANIISYSGSIPKLLYSIFAFDSILISPFNHLYIRYVFIRRYSSYKKSSIA